MAIAFAVLVTNAFQLAFFYGTSFEKVKTFLAENSGSIELGTAGIAGVMFFQVLSVRTAGFQVIDVKRREPGKTPEITSERLFFCVAASVAGWLCGRHTAQVDRRATCSDSCFRRETAGWPTSSGWCGDSCSGWRRTRSSQL